MANGIESLLVVKEAGSDGFLDGEDFLHVVNKPSRRFQVCKVGDELKERLKKFRFRKDKTNAAIFLKCHKEEGVIIEEEFEDCTIEDLQAELCEHVPRFVVLSYVYKHDDGRVSYPLCFIFSSPQGSKPELQMLYAGSVQDVIQQLGITKTFDIRSTEELTEEWLLKKLEFFR